MIDWFNTQKFAVD